MSTTAAVRFVAEKLRGGVPGLTISKSGQLTIDRTKLHSGNEIYAKLESRCAANIAYEIAKQFPLEYATFRRPEFGAELEKELVRIIHKESYVDPSTAYFNDSIQEPLSKLKLILNVQCKRRSCLYESGRDLIHSYDYDLIFDTLKAKLGDDGRAEWMGTNSEQCLFNYAPFQPRIYTNDKGHKVFNSWTDAEWCKSWGTSVEDSPCPQEIEEFFNAFIDNPTDIHAVKAWLRDCCFSKAEPILVLCGVPGVGKNIFVNTIAGALVGHHNRREATRNFANSAFHSNISSCRLFLLDEAELDPKSRETLKAYHNGTAAIERKGVDVGDPEQIFASFVLANNHWQKIKLEYSDRKFYTPTLSTVELKKTLGQKKIDRLVKLMTDPSYIHRLANYLWNNFKEGDAKVFPKNSFFEQVCLNSATAWFRKFHHLCKHLDSFSSREFNKGLRYRVDPFILKDEIEVYKSQRDGSKLAELEILPDGNWIATSEIFVGTKDIAL